MKRFRSNLFLNISKLTIIVFFGVIILTNFVPFYINTPNSYVYGVQTMRLAEGSWSTTNELLEATGKWVFVPGGWKKTVDNHAVTQLSPGLPAMSLPIYLMGGMKSLFYIGPIITIILLIVAERISTNLFGKYVGLLTLLFIATHGYVFTIGQHFLTDNLFLVLTILGVFCLIKFLHIKHYRFLLISSLLFTFTSFVRLNGVIYFPMEIIIISGYFIIKNYKISKQIDSSEDMGQIIQLSKISKLDVRKTSLYIITPWLIFFVFFSSYNTYYFGDPMITVFNVPGDVEVRPGTKNYFSILEFNSDNVNLIKAYSNYVLPYPIYRIEVLDFQKIVEERDDPITQTFLNMGSGLVGKNNFGLITIMSLPIFLALSFYFKTKRLEIAIFSLIIALNIMFWSANHVAQGRDSVMGRYMLTAFPFFVVMFSFFVIGFLKTKILHKYKFKKIIIKSIKITLIIILILFFIVAFLNSAPVQIIKNQEFTKYQQLINTEYYPLDREGLESDSIIVGGSATKNIDYGFTTFNPYVNSPNLRGSVFNPELLDQNVITLLKDFISESKNVYVFKELANKNERLLREALTEDYGIEYRDFSKSFCKLELSNNYDNHSESNTQKFESPCYGINKN